MDEDKPRIEFEEGEDLLWHKVRFAFDLNVPCEIAEPDIMTTEQRDDFIRMAVVDQFRWYIDNIDKFLIAHKFISKKELDEKRERNMRIDARNWQELLAFMSERR